MSDKTLSPTRLLSDKQQVDICVAYLSRLFEIPEDDKEEDVKAAKDVWNTLRNIYTTKVQECFTILRGIFKMKGVKVVSINGCPGTGKSTVIKEISKSLGEKYLVCEEPFSGTFGTLYPKMVNYWLKKPEETAFSQEYIPLVKAWNIIDTIMDYLKGSVSVESITILIEGKPGMRDDVFIENRSEYLSGEERESVSKSVDEAQALIDFLLEGYELTNFILQCDPPVAAKRVVGRSAREGDGDSLRQFEEKITPELADLARIFDNHLGDSEEFYFPIDTTTKTVSESVSEIMALL